MNKKIIPLPKDFLKEDQYSSNFLNSLFSGSFFDDKELVILKDYKFLVEYSIKDYEDLNVVISLRESVKGYIEVAVYAEDLQLYSFTAMNKFKKINNEKNKFLNKIFRKEYYQNEIDSYKKYILGQGKKLSSKIMKNKESLESIISEKKEVKKIILDSYGSDISGQYFGDNRHFSLYRSYLFDFNMLKSFCSIGIMRNVDDKNLVRFEFENMKFKNEHGLKGFKRFVKKIYESENLKHFDCSYSQEGLILSNMKFYAYKSDINLIIKFLKGEANELL